MYKNNKIVGGLGVSGDTPCTDQETAKRMRNMAGLNPPGGMKVDDIVFSSIDGPSVFAHPLCQNTYRDGKFLGNEEPGIYGANAMSGSAGRERQHTASK